MLLQVSVSSSTTRIVAIAISSVRIFDRRSCQLLRSRHRLTAIAAF
jgi:hypothetical protein